MTIRVCRIAQGFLLLVVGLSASGYADGTIYHQAPAEAVAQGPLTLEAVIEVEDAGVVSASIYYRLRGQLTYQEIPMSSAGGNLYFGTIPAADVTEPGLEYYLVAFLDDESILAYPVDDPEVNPVFVAVKSAAVGIAGAQEPLEAAAGVEEADVLILSPEPREMYLPEDVVIAASLFNVQDLDTSSIRLLVDRQDVTAQTDVTADLVTYTPPALSTGAHQVEIHMNRASGSPYMPVAWRFLVSRVASVSTERAFRQSGAVTPAFRRDNIDDQLLEVSSMKLSYRGGWDWLQFRTKVKLTTQEDPFKPPRNRYSASFQTPLLTLGIGDVTPRLDRFTLDGKRLRGYDANLTLGLFNLRLARGELERVIQGRPEAAYSVTDFDSNADSLTVSRSGYTFRRDITAIRPSFGSGQRFELAFSFIKAKDNIVSVEPIVDDGIIQIDTSDVKQDPSAFAGANWIDQSLGTIAYKDLKELFGSKLGLPEKDWKGKSPQDNLVIGSSLSFALNQRRFVVQSGFALSMLNKNIWDPVLSLKELDTFAPGDTVEDGSIAGIIDTSDIPINPGDLEDYFHINLNQVPLLPIDVFALSENPLQAVLKMPSLAYHATAKFNYMRNFITLEYQQVGPEFNSLANPNLQKNVRIRSISDRVRLFSNKLFISALYRATDDDIVKVEGDPITTTKMVNLSANFNLGRGLPSLVLGRRTYQRDNGVDTLSISLDAEDLPIDTTDSREEMLTKSTNLGLSYRLQMLTSTHDLNLNLASTVIGDEIDVRYPELGYRSQTASSNILSLAAVSRFSSGLETIVVVSTNKSEIGEEKHLIKQSISSLNLTARLLLLNGKLRTSGGITFRSNDTNKGDDPSAGENTEAPASFTQFGIKAGASFKLIENLRLVTAFEFRNKTLEVDGKTETLPSSIISANLEYTF